MSNQPPFDIDTAHRWFGIEFNNGIFPLLEKPDRTEEETEIMIAMVLPPCFTGAVIQNTQLQTVQEVKT